MLLYEILLKEVEGPELDYLEEYLILTESITLKEAKKLIALVEQMHQNVEKQMEGRFHKLLSKLSASYSAKIKEARKAVALAKAEGKSTKTIANLNVKLDNLKQAFSVKKAELVKRFENLVKSVGDKAAKNKSLIRLKALKVKYPKTAKGGKYALAGTAAAAAGYGAYKVFKNKKMAKAKA